MAKQGRPTSYTPELAATICEQLAEGKSLRKICRMKGMPAKSSVFKWLGLHPDFADQYARAREAQAEALADEIVQIADECKDPQKGRLQVDARKWVASKLLPKKYGDRVSHELTGPEGGPVQISHITEQDRLERLEVLRKQASQANSQQGAASYGENREDRP